MKSERKCPVCKKRMTWIMETCKRVCRRCGYPDKEKMALRAKRKKPIRITLIQRILKKDRPIIKKVEG